SALGKLLPLDFVGAAGGPFYEVRHANTKFEHPPVILVSNGFGDHTRLIHHRPELIVAASIVVSHARGAISWIGAHQDHFHSLAQVIRQCPHRKSKFLPSISRPLRLISAIGGIQSKPYCRA